ncbi:MAG: recombinase family protein [Oscillospiraceae bacterium]|nr:recombinase family protein [Oscillospiraceae bacterium]
MNSTMKAIISVIIYIRYSSHAQDDGNSVEAQIACCTEYASNHGMDIERIYIDTAKSGRYTNRPEYQRMISDLKTGTVKSKVLLVRAIDRLHRNAKNMLADLDLFDNLGITLIGVHDGVDTSDEKSRLVIQLRASIAEEYSRNLSYNTRNALLESARHCQHLGGTPPLGYKVNDVNTYDVDDDTAPIIRDIFKLYLHDFSYREIIQHCKDKGYRTSEGNDFSKASINAILRNVKYMGTYTYDRSAPKDSEGKRNSYAKKENYIKIPNGMPVIISEEDFEKAQEKLKNNAERQAHRNGKNYYALNSMIRCAGCGRAVTGNPNHSKGKIYLQYRYTCDCQHRHKSVSVNELNTYIFDALKEVLFCGENKERILGYLNEIINVQTHMRSSELSSIKVKIQKTKTEQDNLVACLGQGRGTETILSNIEKNEKLLKQLKEQLALKEKKICTMNEELYNEAVESFVAYMSDVKTVEAVELKDALIDHIDLSDERVVLHFKNGLHIDKDTIKKLSA